MCWQVDCVTFRPLEPGLLFTPVSSLCAKVKQPAADHSDIFIIHIYKCYDLSHIILCQKENKHIYYRWTVMTFTELMVRQRGCSPLLETRLCTQTVRCTPHFPQPLSPLSQKAPGKTLIQQCGAVVIHYPNHFNNQ